MNVLAPLFFGFLSSAIGILPPGLINMTAVKVSTSDGDKRAMFFVSGALLIIFFQAYISLIFALYINSHEEVIVLLREIGLAIFIGIAVYFFFFAKDVKPLRKKKKIQLRSRKSRFFMGMLISALNFFPIPYYVLVTLTLASYKLFEFSYISIFSFVAGVLMGSFLVFYGYIVFFEKFKERTEFFTLNMNKIIGLITALVALFTLINVIDYYL